MEKNIRQENDHQLTKISSSYVLYNVMKVNKKIYEESKIYFKKENLQKRH